MAQDVGQAFLDARQVAATIFRGFQPLEQMMDALLDMAEGRAAVAADLQVIEAVRNRADSVVEIGGIGLRRTLARLKRGG